jgi:hypothetical protein
MKPQDTPPKINIPPAPVDVEEKLQRTRKELEQRFKEFHKLLESKILKENTSDAVLKTEKYIVDSLVKTCARLENINMGEGVMALSVISLREHLKLRDRVNELEYQLALTKRELNRLKKSDADKKK